MNFYMLKKETVFNSLYDAYWEKIVRLCLAYTGNYEEARDLAQESFLKAWQHIEKFRNESPISTWIYRIAVNACLTHLRLSKRMSSAKLTGAMQLQLSNDVGINDKIGILYKIISQLPELDRLLITLVLEEVPYTEIGEILNISQGNLRVRIHRVKQSLSQLFKQYE
jgi:RNA polymerase sigma factor (sigma-70 family)